MADTGSQAKETEALTIIDSRYRVVREIARGGIGTVFEAKHVFTNKVVALKLLTSNQQHSAEAQARLLREAQALSKIKHPHIVDVLDAGMTRNGQVYLVTELIDGRSLDGVLAARGRLEPKKALELALQLASALAAVHEHGIVHRDVKPHNVLLRGTTNDRIYVKLVDFGAAMVEDVDVKLTKAGEILGTVEYMAPEQLLGESGAATCDIYGLGVTLYECLTGTVPYAGNLGQVLLAVTNGPYPSMLRHVPDISPELDALVARALASKAVDRFPSMASFAEAMTNQLNAYATPAKPAAQVETRRAYARAAYVTPVRLLLEGDTHCDGRTEDISEGGVLIFTERDLDAGRRVLLRFAAPMTGLIVEVMATAKWTREQRGRRVTGFEFINAPRGVIDSIKRYVGLIAGP